MVFNVHVGGTVDRVLITNRWTIRVIDDLALRESQKGAIEEFRERALSIFKPVKYTEKALLNQYIRHTHAVTEQIQRILEEAKNLRKVLTNLENRLDNIYGIMTSDDVNVKAEKDEILAELWTLVGGNRSKISEMDKKLEVIRHVNIYRKTALMHVTDTIVKLQAIDAGLEDLRERVEAPGLLKGRLDVPLDVHLETIIGAVERLDIRRKKSRQEEDAFTSMMLRRTDDPNARKLIDTK